MVYSEKEILYTDLEDHAFIARTGILGIQLGFFMTPKKRILQYKWGLEKNIQEMQFCCEIWMTP